MWPSLVVVLKPISQNALKVPTIEDQKPIETVGCKYSRGSQVRHA